MPHQNVLARQVLAACALLTLGALFTSGPCLDACPGAMDRPSVR